jgi:hypothetical protein
MGTAGRGTAAVQPIWRPGHAAKANPEHLYRSRGVFDCNISYERMYMYRGLNSQDGSCLKLECTNAHMMLPAALINQGKYMYKRIPQATTQLPPSHNTPSVMLTKTPIPLDRCAPHVPIAIFCFFPRKCSQSPMCSRVREQPSIG